MDAPAMLTTKHVPEDVGLRNVAAAEEEGGQGQMHRGEEKQHKPVLKKVKEKVKKIKNTIAGGGGGGHGGNNGGERASGSSSSSEEGEDDVAAQRMGDVDQRGYQEDVEEDKPVAMESDPEVHGAPMYDSARIPSVQEVEGDGGAPRVRLGDLGGPVVEDPAAPRSTTRVPREGEDIGTTPVVRAFESMSVSDDPKHVGAAGKPDADVQNDPMPVSDAATAGEEWKDATPDSAAAGATPGATYTDKIKSAAAGTTEYGKKLATTVYEKVAGVGTAVAGKVRQVTQSAGTATPGVAGRHDRQGAGGARAGARQGARRRHVAHRRHPCLRHRAAHHHHRGGWRGGGIGAGDSRGGDRRDPTSAERKHDMKRCRNGSSRVCLYVATYTRVSVRKVSVCLE